MERDLVLLHGWAMSPRVWESVTPGLGALWRVHNLGLPGYDRPDPAAGRYEAMSCRELLDRWSEDCLMQVPAGSVWVGWSLGALVVMNALLRGAGDIAAAVLVSATPKFIRDREWEAGVESGVMRGFLDGMRICDDKTMRRFRLLQAGGSDDPRRLAGMLSRCMAGPRSAGVLEAGLRVLEETDLRTALGALDAPLRIVHGLDDRIVPWAAGSWIAKHAPRAELVSLDAGHAPFITQPRAFVQAVAEWC